MAAIIEPRRLHAHPAPRPALRLVSAHDGRPVAAPVELGISSAHVAGAVAALVLAMVLALAIGNGAFASLAPAPTTAPAASASVDEATQITVESGDTLWSIARRAQPTGDVRPLVDQLLATYGSAPLQPGQQVAVPS
jgi:LysM repeat protein